MNKVTFLIFKVFMESNIANEDEYVISVDAGIDDCINLTFQNLVINI